MNRTQTTLLGLLLLQIVLIGIFRSPLTGAAGRNEPRPLFPELQAISPTRLQIDGADDRRVTLVRQGESWTIDEIGGFPADADKVSRLLDDLEGIEVRRPVVTGSSHHKAFKVTAEEHEARLRIWDAGDDEPQVSLILGSSANYRTTHARLEGESEVYEIQGIAPYDVRPDQASWIRKELAEDVGEVDRLTLRNGAGRFELELRDGVWTVASPADRRDEELDQDGVLALLRTVTALRLVDAAGPLDETAQGFVEPAASLMLGWSSDGHGGKGIGAGEWTLRVGGMVPGEETQRFVTGTGFGFAGTIRETSIGRLLDDTQDDLRAEPDAG